MAENRAVLMLTAETGGGHRSVSLAIKERFRKALPGYELQLVNAFDEVFDFPFSLISGAHRQIVRRSPVLWSLLFESTSTGRTFSRIESLARPWTKYRVKALFDAIRPCAVISVVPLVNELVGEIASRQGVPFAVVVTDMARIHPAWLSRQADIFCAPTAFAERELRDRGIPPEKIFLTGLPTRAGFFDKPIDRKALRRRLGIDESSFSILMMGGGEGVGLSERAIEEIISLPGLELNVIAGRNARLKKRICDRFKERVRALGFVENVHDWLMAVDLLVTKSGPSTLVEAAAARTPTLFVGALPGQEQSIIDNLISAVPGGRFLVCDDSNVSRRIEQVMESDVVRSMLVNAIEDFANPAAADEVCLLVRSLINEQGNAAQAYA